MIGGKTEGMLPDLSGLRLDPAATVPLGVSQDGTWRSGTPKYKLDPTDIDLINLLAKFGIFAFYKGVFPNLPAAVRDKKYSWSYKVRDRAGIFESWLTEDERRTMVTIHAGTPNEQRLALFSRDVDPLERYRVCVKREILEYAHKVLNLVGWFKPDPVLVGTESLRPRFSGMRSETLMPEVVLIAVTNLPFYEQSLQDRRARAEAKAEQRREELRREEAARAADARRRMDEIEKRAREERERLAREREAQERAEEQRARRRTELQEKEWNGGTLTDEERAELRTLFAELEGTSDDEFEIQWSKVVVRWRTEMKQDEYNLKLGRGEEGTNVKAPKELPSVQMAWLNEGLLAIAAAAVERVRTAFTDVGKNADVDCDKLTGVAAAEFQLPWSWDNYPSLDRPAQWITIRIRATTQPSRCRTVSVNKRQRHGDEHHAHGGVVWTLLLPDDRSNPAQVEARKIAREGMSSKFGYAISKTSTDTSHPQVSSTNALRSFLHALWDWHWQAAVANSPEKMKEFFLKFSKWTPEAPGVAPVQAGPLIPAPPRAAAEASGGAGPSTDNGADDDDEV